MDKKLDIARVQDEDKVAYATHYLEGPANIWWDNLREVVVDNHVISWIEFKASFRKAHIPDSLMKIKQQEFLALTQGSMSITEYVNKFNRLARYARDDTNTEEKKKGSFSEWHAPSPEDLTQRPDIPRF